ncbi:putative diacylglycerol O-acyltransferase tgs2 [Folsomia candida]|uniref:Putative diacylglycerol O-acyltransferase tgs2 n=2 Tax=Folsomia candida TaxID=158441 RepID=A0A226EQ37_FOLCA|nr:putative diacylglycerol O-acyltransferase tgs2 [Folsomia candida]
MGKVLSSRSIPAASEDLYENPRMTIVLGIVCEGNNLELQSIREIVKKEAILARDSNGNLKYPELGQNITTWMGYSFWKPIKDFKLEDHINYFDDSENSELTASELSHHLRTMSLRPFSKSSALWELRIVPNFYFDNETHKPSELELQEKYSLLIFRCHHSLGDGLSLLQLFDKFALTNKVILHPKSNVDMIGGNLCRWFKFLVKLPHDLGIFMFNSKMKPGKVLWRKQVLNKKASQSSVVKKLLPTISEEDGTFSGSVSGEFPFSRIQELSQQYRVSSGTSIILAGVCSVVRTFMLQSQEQDKLTDVPLQVNFPLPRRSDKLRNHAMVTSIMLPIGEEDSVQRLLKIEKALALAKSSTLTIFSVYAVNILTALPDCIMRKVMKRLYQKDKIFFSNFAGPLQPIDMFGSLVKRFYFTCGMVKDSNTLGMTIGSYAGNVAYSIAADQRLIPSCEIAKSYTNIFLKELEILEQSFVV